ncbi:FecCD family ABC transporter permease [Hoeflea marina]|nr:iron chelate uptake ABC transporter family permease subunit [Hoeflea marina]
MPQARATENAGPQTRRRVLLMASGCAVLLLVCIASLIAGARTVSISTVAAALFAYDGGNADHIAIADYRLPRTLLGLMCGAAFGVSGALMQATTRNPLADPGLLGVNAGAAFFVTVAAGVFGVQAMGAQLGFAFLGAIAATLMVHALGSVGRDGATPLRLLLAGVAITAVLGGFGQAVTLLNPMAFDSLRVWMIGSLAGRDTGVVYAVAPFIVAGLMLALLVSPSMNAIALGEDQARALGTRIAGSRLMAAVSVTLLAGAATAAVGPIGFVGLMAPHVVRWLFGPDQRLVVAGTMVFAPILLISADILGRFLLRPGELEAGIVTAFVGAPVLILLVRRSKVSRL